LQDGSVSGGHDFYRQGSLSGAQVRKNYLIEFFMKNRGTTFEITDLPADYYPDTFRSEKRPRILCVENDTPVRNAICSTLNGRGWHCEGASGGADALQALAACPESIDIVVASHRMAEMTGTEFVRKVRARTTFTGKILVRTVRLLRREQADYEELEVDAIIPDVGSTDALLKPIEKFHQDKPSKQLNEHF